MRRMLFAILLLTSSVASAACFDLMEYRDSKVFVSISDGGCATSVKITTAPVKKGNVVYELKEELEFDDECKLSDNHKFLTCRVNKKNPFSGATYQKFESGKESCDNVSESEQYPAFEYRCIKGCKGVLRRFSQNWSCGC